MSFNWNFFKSKSRDESSHAGKSGQAREDGRKKSAESGSPVAKPVKNKTAERKLGGAFVPAVFTPPGAANQKNQPASAQPGGSREIVILLGDVIGRIPSRFLRPGPHDPKMALRFDAHDLVSDIARGRATVRLVRIAKLCPEIFAGEIAEADDADVPLPLQKLIGQISALRSIPTKPPKPQSADPKPAAGILADEKNEGVVSQAATELRHANETEKTDGPASATPVDSAPSEAAKPDEISPSQKTEPLLIQAPQANQEAPADAAEPIQQTAAASGETPAPADASQAPQAPVFDQSRLQMLLITGETLDEKKVAELVAELPDVSGCLLFAGGATYRAGKVAEGIDADFFSQRTIEWLSAMQALKLGTMRAFTAHGTEHAATLFANVRTGLCVFHDDYGLLPGYIEKLDAIVAEVARMVSEK